jgi:DNA topoisomerase-1
VLAARALAAGERPDKQGARKQALSLAIEQVASSLGNTPTVCRKCYIHPAVLDAYEAGVTAPASLAGKQLQPYKALRQDERRAVALLLHWQKTAKRRDLGAQTRKAA